MKALRVTRHGGPEVLSLEEAPVPEPTDAEVLVAVDVAGVNYIDTYFREGVYPAEPPFTPGFEGTGRVVKDPTGTIAEGTRVAWCDAFGSYAEFVCVPRDRLVAVPRGMDLEVAASMLLQGITAHYLTHGVVELGEGDSCVITAGAGGVGRLVTQFARARGARVYSVVSSDAKEQLARDAGATEVFRYGEDLAEQVLAATQGRGVDVVYDGVGKDTFAQSLCMVRPRGVVCLFGAASGAVDPIDPQELNAHGSIFLTRPSIGAWTAEPGEFVMRAQAVTQAIAEGVLDIRVGASYPLADGAQAHRDLQDRATTGAVVLRISDED
ncbi:NADPH:quinone reductase [Corynebacterium sp. 13CS0277]|uniref:quinone oxidoreductase family protein n=1 Tax=Corynebacterium sp. 13CS0277 TaxID=2071994 RepID=UPI000D032BFA|nr:quinone oxidoreductase [Corynebacterium sp. 13CS0277]PRQ11912.1 NADPH:quinone reductase [Corynebacterium sp. 13CS0277]